MAAEMLDSIGPTVLTLVATYPLETVALLSVVYVCLKYRDVLTYRG